MVDNGGVYVLCTAGYCLKYSKSRDALALVLLGDCMDLKSLTREQNSTQENMQFSNHANIFFRARVCAHAWVIDAYMTAFPWMNNNCVFCGCVNVQYMTFNSAAKRFQAKTK